MASKSKKVTKPNVPTSKDDAWITKHFNWLVDNFGGRYLVVAEEEPFIGYDVAELERKAQAKHPGVVTTGMPIPRPEDFISVLWNL